MLVKAYNISMLFRVRQEKFYFDDYGKSRISVSGIHGKLCISFKQNYAFCKEKQGFGFGESQVKLYFGQRKSRNIVSNNFVRESGRVNQSCVFLLGKILFCNVFRESWESCVFWSGIVCEIYFNQGELYILIREIVCWSGKVRENCVKYFA